MSYIINKTDGSVLTTINDGTVDNTSDLILVGKNYSGYGRYQNENFVHLLENFSNTTAPASPLKGQLWYDSTNQAIKVYNNTGFKIPPAAVSSGTAPTNKTVGDLWYDSTNEQLNFWDGSVWKIIGPSFSASLGTTGDVIDTISDGVTNHTVIKKYLTGSLIAVISKDSQFTPSPAVAGFATIRPGYNISSNYDMNVLHNAYVSGDGTISGNLTVSGSINGTANKAINVTGGAAGSLVIQTNTDTTGFVSIGANGTVLTSNGSTAVWSSAAAASSVAITDTTTTNSTFYPTFVANTTGSHSVLTDSSTLTYDPNTNTLTVANLSGTASKATNVVGGAAGSVVYQSNTDTTALLPIGAAGTVLESTGTGIQWGTGMPSGALMPFAGSSVPTGWLLCYGQAVSRTTYAALFTAIGITWGNGDGSTTFNLPDFRGRILAGADDMGGSNQNRLSNGANGGFAGNAVLGTTAGEKSHQLTTAELAAHAHNSIARQGSQGVAGSTYDTAMGPYDQYTASAGGDQAHNNVQPTAVVNYIIKV